MGLPVFMVRRYQSRYGLLATMAEELAEVLERAGCEINPSEAFGQRPGVMVYLNHLTDPQWIEAACAGGGAIAVVQLFVDHPLALSEDLTDRLAEQPHFRLALSTLDGLSLAAARWPSLQIGVVHHGVSEQAVCEENSVSANRAKDVVASGWIHTEEELDALTDVLDLEERRLVRDVAASMIEQGELDFEQALQRCSGGAFCTPDRWRSIAGVWRAVIARVNRTRRVAAVQAMQGLRLEVFGPEAWERYCTGTIRYGGEARYEQMPAIYRSAKTAIAWGPTQFARGYSERQLLAMAGGCASVSDDRELLRRHFVCDGEKKGSQEIAVYPAGSPEHGAEQIAAWLRDRDKAIAVGHAGREAVMNGHLWSHRAKAVLELGADGIHSAIRAAELSQEGMMSRNRV
ncbi:MAG: glycosyltransferase [Planctomycetota bacterium]